jgi:hypothetical protein
MTDDTSAQGPPGGSIPLHLGAGTAPINRRTPILLWGAAAIALGLTIAVLLSEGEIRSIVLLLLMVLGLFCLSPKRGIYIVLVFLPFMYFLRRQVLHFNEFSKTDPILLFPPLVTIAMFLGYIIFYTADFFRYLQRSLLMKLLVALQVIYFVEIFNPLQGNILVGVAGAMYFMVPMLWVFMGLLLDERAIRRIFMFVIVIGTITAAYGAYQHFFGLSEVERYEAESKNFLFTFGTQVRVMSTFASMGDFSLYATITAFLAFAHYWRTKANLIYFGPAALAICCIFWGSVRAAMFALAFSIVMFLIVYARNKPQVVLRATLACLIVGSIYGYLYTYTPKEIWEVSKSKDPFVVHSVSGLAHPTEESSFTARVENWTYIVKSAFTEYPAGRGIGSTTVAARKFEGGRPWEADSLFFELIYGSSPLAAFLFLLITVVIFRDLLTLIANAGEPFTYRVVLGVLAAFFLSSYFGQSLRDSVNSPFAWLLIGWTVREIVARGKEGQSVAGSAA